MRSWEGADAIVGRCGRIRAASSITGEGSSFAKARAHQGVEDENGGEEDGDGEEEGAPRSLEFARERACHARLHILRTRHAEQRAALAQMARYGGSFAQARLALCVSTEKRWRSELRSDRWRSVSSSDRLSRRRVWAASEGRRLAAQRLKRILGERN
eukprot:6211145-Pleurochrysis_carterae.AAC.2